MRRSFTVLSGSGTPTIRIPKLNTNYSGKKMSQERANADLLFPSDDEAPRPRVEKKHKRKHSPEASTSRASPARSPIPKKKKPVFKPIAPVKKPSAHDLFGSDSEEEEEVIVPASSALDPAFPLWNNNNNKFRKTDGVYTEVIHTNAGILGYIAPLGDADFYPNGGSSMPGCNSNECDHKRAFFFMGESLRTGGFTGRRCATYIGALTGNCALFGNLRMGGLVPKTGSSGIFWLETNASPPFSRG